MSVSLDLSVACTGFTDTAQGHTVYNVSCRASLEGATMKKTFSVDKRFSEFEELHKALQPLLPSIPSAFPVAKTMMTTEATKRERVDKFQDYLRGAVSAAGPSPPGLLLKFLAVDVKTLQQAAVSSDASAPSPIGNVTADEDRGTPFGVASAPASSDANEALRDGIKRDNTAECVRLLDGKADPNFRDRRGDCPLHLACMFNRTQVVKALLEHGADMTLKNAAGELPTKIAPVTLRMKMEKFSTQGKF
tara:strand:- start:2646 stop:3389 length:744 start_codon:yes stop_codon:yes gene_type:complete